MALLVPAEAGHAGPCKPLQYLDTHRPWLSLYGTRVRPVPAFGSLSNKPVSDPALIHRILPDELLFEVFARMTPYTLGRAACVCRKWHYAIRSPCLWHNACINTWQLSGLEENYKILQTDFGGSWRKMWLHRPRLRFDGLYVSRNTYIRAGIAEWKTTNPVHLVEAAILYPGLRPTVLRIRLRLRGTTIGANNRLDLVSLVTSGIGENEVKVEEDVLEATEGWQEDETHNPDVPAVSHSRGLSALVFVPFDEVDTSDLNLPVEKMDYFVPG